MFKQLPLSIQLRVDATFDNFYIAESNSVAIEALKYFCAESSESFYYLWGVEGSGITHVLQAIQHQQPDASIQYLPLVDVFANANDYQVDEIFAGLESLDIIVVDDLQQLAGTPSWELAFFHLYNRLRDAGKQLLVGAHQSPRELKITLPDLQSRLQWGVSYQLFALNDDEKKQAILFRAEALGMRISEEVLQFMLTHCSRDLRALVSMLNQLDKASLAEKRQITVPFLKQVFDV